MVKNKTNPTIDDIARELGVSKTTISRAISGKGRISDATRERVLAYIQQRNYRPSAAARGLAESRTYNLALVLPRSFIKLDQPFARLGMSAVCEEAFLQDYNVLVCLSTDDNPESLIRTLDNRKVDGVILSRTVNNDPAAQLLIQREIPFATMGSLPQGMQGKATVEVDHDQVGGCHAFCKQVMSGMRGKIALLGNDMDYVVNQSRLEGFRRAARELGLGEESLFVRTGLQEKEACVQNVQTLLAMGIRNFITMDDEVCMRVLPILKQQKMFFPWDLQLASLYDSEQLRLAEPAVTALSFDAAAIGQVACRELINALWNQPYDPAPKLGYTFSLRESTVD